MRSLRSRSQKRNDGHGACTPLKETRPMNVEIFALCDAATISGKLNILGVFDTLWATTTPVVHNACALAMRVRFEQIESGDKRVQIAIVDIDGHSVLQPASTTIQVRHRAGVTSATAQMVIQIQNLQLPRFGEYQIDLAIDGRVEKTIPLFAKQRPAQTVQGNA